MIICLCHGVNEKKIQECIDEGFSSMSAVQQRCGAGSDCGSCRFKLKRMLQESAPQTENPKQQQKTARS